MSEQSRADLTDMQRHAAGADGNNRRPTSAGENQWGVEVVICAPGDGPVCTNVCTSWGARSRSGFRKPL